MFRCEQFGKVNANPVGQYAPETLLVVGPDEVKELKTGWNRFLLRPGGTEYARVVDSAGNPVYAAFGMTAADLEGVRVTPFHARLMVPLSLGGGTVDVGEPPDADAPHVVTS
jgi:hypothetical protein